MIMMMMNFQLWELEGGIGHLTNGFLFSYFHINFPQPVIVYDKRKTLVQLSFPKFCGLVASCYHLIFLDNSTRLLLQ